MLLLLLLLLLLLRLCLSLGRVGLHQRSTLGLL